MIIIKVMGGLGNQMQQYALYEKFKALGKEARLDISWFEDEAQQKNALAKRALELRLFDGLSFEKASEEERRNLLGREGFWGKLSRKLNPSGSRHFLEKEMYHPEIFSFADMYLEGHWACEKYYHDIMPLLRQKIRFPKSADGRNAETMERMVQENSVSVHIRRGDYLDPENAGMFGGICTDAYYESAFAYVRERMPDAHFYLFSDDPEYLRRTFHGKEFTVVDWNRGADSFFDCQLMSSCRANICANSTFSFWGARLNGKADRIAVRPAKHKNSQGIEPERMHELWEGWALIDEKGNVL